MTDETRKYIDTAFSEILRQMKSIQTTLEEIKEISEKSKSSAGGPRKKRRPSKYNRFIAVCMKGTGKTMKTCAAEYKQVKSEGTLDEVIAQAE
jgi:hypothetical protein